MIAKIVDFITTDIWRIRLKTISGPKAVLLRPLIVVVLALRSFRDDKCQLRASALTFYSLLSIVPVFAMAFGVAKGFGFQKLLEQSLLRRLPGNEEVITQVIGFSNSLLEKTKGGAIAGIGVAVLFWTVIKVFENVEASFNDIWAVEKARSIARRFSNYLSIMLICPLLFIISSSATVVITAQVKLIMEKIALLGALSPIIFAGLNLIPLAVILVLFSFLYVFMPNTDVRLVPGIVGGLVAAVLYQVTQWAYITFQVSVAKYNAIYGSFAALPLFLVWLHVSWSIVLVGAEVSFAIQNLETYEFGPDCDKVSHNFKMLLTLRIAHLLVDRFSKGHGPYSASGISDELDIPIRLVRQILTELVEARVLSEAKDKDTRAVAYQPGLATHYLTVKDIIDGVENSGADNIPVNRSTPLYKLADVLGRLDDTARYSPANVRLEDI